MRPSELRRCRGTRPAYFLFGLVSCQKVLPDKQLAGTESIGDAIQDDDKAAASYQRRDNTGAMAEPVEGIRPIHILYLHGINQVGAGDSLLLRKGICKYLGECAVTSLGRMYADGPCAVDSAPPTLAYWEIASGSRRRNEVLLHPLSTDTR
jgi:hypothetical protein